MYDDVEIRKLCVNCAYRVPCKKRYRVTIAKGEVQCIEYEADFEIIARLKKELQRQREGGGKPE